VHVDGGSGMLHPYRRDDVEEPMSAVVVIVCDECGDAGTTGRTATDARAELKHWARRDGRDLCPLCRLIEESHERITSAGP
jgi:hypothetical protein